MKTQQLYRIAEPRPARDSDIDINYELPHKSPMRRFTGKLVHYLNACAILKGPNLRGVPFLPKRIFPTLPYNRKEYNVFIGWLDALQLKDVGQVIDIGSNHGDFAQAVSTFFPHARVELVEPLPTLHAELKRRGTERPGRWNLSVKALSNRAGEAELHIDPKSDAIGSLLEYSSEYRTNNLALSETTTVVKCETETLDALAVRNGFKRIDLLKIDVEGFEFEVLEGALETLRNTEAVVIEVSLIRKTRSNFNPLLEMIKLLMDAGFSIVRVLPSLYSPTEEWRPVEFNILGRRSHTNHSHPEK